jgi:phosphoribosylaminoimidazole-succinocarboxamide synthase
MNGIGKVELPYKLFRRGKVRDVYEIDNQLLIISSDRISAFDYVLPSLIPEKGKVLNSVSAFWFDYTKNLLPNHMICADPENLEQFREHREVLAQRSVLTKKVKTFPVEAIVRGYIVGSGWKTYQANGNICGIEIPPGLEFADKFEKPIFTPTTKADEGHDTNMTYEEMENLIGKDYAGQIKEASIFLFKKASEFASEKGIILADTKFEFGQDENGELILIDEIFTPDSSRFWKLDEYRESKTAGTEPPSYDKQYVRNFLLNSDWDRNSAPPELPVEVVAETTNKYKEIYQILTGKNI